MRARAASVLLVLVACGDNTSPGEALRAQIRDDDYHSWARPPGYDERRASAGDVHGDLGVEIFTNPTLANAIASGATEFPDGSIAVVEGYTSAPPHGVVADETGLFLTAAMKKIAGAWFWVSWDGSDQIFNEGTPQLCTACHKLGTDMVRSRPRSADDPPPPPPPMEIDDPARPNFGGVCASFIQCDDEAPVCVTPTHDEVYGFCTRICETDADCASPDGRATCLITVTDIPGINSPVRMCAFHCDDCPESLACTGERPVCLPSQEQP